MDYIQEEFMRIAETIIMDKRVERMREYVQHGSTSCLQHCVSVAYCSFVIAKRFNLKCDYESMVRGALLHDYFLYDWHVSDKSHRLHGFTHARRAMENAEKDFELNPIERDIILKHMFPLNVIPPKYVESYVVTLADKICSTYETIWGVPNFRWIKEVVN